VPDHVIFTGCTRWRPTARSSSANWLYAPEVVAGGRGRVNSVELFHRVNQQDFDACERCQLSMTSRMYADGGVLVPSEHTSVPSTSGSPRSWPADTGSRLTAGAPAGAHTAVRLDTAARSAV